MSLPKLEFRSADVPLPAQNPADLAAEIERLREENAALVQTSADLCIACGWRFFVPGDGCQKCELDRARGEADTMRLWAEEAAHAENLNAQDAQKERAAVVAYLREQANARIRRNLEPPCFPLQGVACSY